MSSRVIVKFYQDLCWQVPGMYFSLSSPQILLDFVTFNVEFVYALSDWWFKKASTISISCLVASNVRNNVCVSWLYLCFIDYLINFHYYPASPRYSSAKVKIASWHTIQENYSSENIFLISERKEKNDQYQGEVETLSAWKVELCGIKNIYKVILIINDLKYGQIPSCRRTQQVKRKLEFLLIPHPCPFFTL